MGIAGGSPGCGAGGTCQDMRALLGVLQGKARLSPHRGHTLLPIRSEGRGEQGHQLQGGSGDAPGAPRTAAVSCSPLPGHPGPSQSGWDNSQLWEQSRHSEGLCPTTAVSQPGGTARPAPVPSHPCIHAGLDHPLPPHRDANPIAASPATRAALGRLKGCGKAGMSSLPNLRGMVAPESP